MPKKPLLDFKKTQDSVRAFFDERAAGFEDRLSVAQRFVHFWVLVWRSFVRNRCPVRASALSYTTLLALIPMLAVVVSVTSSLLKVEGEEKIDQFIQKLVNSIVPPGAVSTNLPLQSADASMNADAVADDTARDVSSGTNSPSVDATPGNASSVASLSQDERAVAARKEAAKRIHEFVRNTRSATLGVTGFVLLLWVAISLLSNIEQTFNDIWGVTRGRTWFARIIQYWATITLGPLLLIVGLGLAGSSQLEGVKRLISSFWIIGHFIFQILPLLVLWLAFTLFYLLMPNTKVKWSAAAVGGLIGSMLWFGNNAFGFLYVSRVVTNSKIYGSLGLVPVFMVGLYFSWLILLFGAQVAYAWQNRAAYLQEKLAENVNQRGREFVALRLMTAIGQRFQRGEKPATIAQMSAELGIPTRLIQQVMQNLLPAKLVIEVGGADGGYAPARPLETINCHHILLAMRAGSGQEPATRDEPARAEVVGEFARIQEAEKQAASSVTMLALVNRAQARFELLPPAGEPGSISEKPRETPSPGTRP